ncbi:MAG: hypothetical protein KF726_05140 [Anaerolineae bacterium]|nr:hypothetical protein [Anaerolineae bacterium]
MLRETYAQAGNHSDETELKFLALIKAGNSLETERQRRTIVDLDGNQAQGNKMLLMRVHHAGILHGERFWFQQLYEQAKLAAIWHWKIGQHPPKQISALNYMAAALFAGRFVSGSNYVRVRSRHGGTVGRYAALDASESDAW